jgi:hypothetical protein
MEFQDLTDKPEITNRDSLDKLALERRLQEAEPARPGTFRYSDAELGGEVRTSVAQEGGIYALAQAEVFHRDGTSEIAGTARYSIAGGEATVDAAHFFAATSGVESALLSEIGEQGRAQGANRLRVWVPDGEAPPAGDWLRRGFHPGERDPGAAGVYWEKPLPTA